VPQMYLRAFTDPTRNQGELWRYGAGFKPQPKSPKGVAWETLFYDAAAELPAEDNDLEDDFADMESIAAPHMQKLREGNVHVTPQEKSELATFFALLITRTRGHRELSNAIIIQLHRLGAKKTLSTPGRPEALVAEHERLTGEKLGVEDVREALRAVAEGEVVLEQTSKAWSLKEIFERAEKLDATLEQMRWNLLRAPDGVSFITSDNPVLLVDPARANARRPKDYPEATATMQLQFPISQKYLLIGGFMGPEGMVLEVSAELVKSFNENQIRRAHREVYASFRSDELQADIDRIFNEREALIPTLPEDIFDD
jgi:hypothetical protein